VRVAFSPDENHARYGGRDTVVILARTPPQRKEAHMSYVCAHCSGKFASKRYRVGTICFCSRLCKLRWEHKLKEFELARSRWFAYLARGSP
jgi:ribosomal protein L37AE/L43A